MRFHALLSEVPPLKTKCSATSNSKTAFKVCDTHQSFSTAKGVIPLFSATCVKARTLVYWGRAKNLFVIIFIYGVPHYYPNPFWRKANVVFQAVWIFLFKFFYN